MGIWAKTLSALRLNSKSAGGVSIQNFRPRISSAGAAGELVTETSSLRLSAVWACGNLISGTLSSLPFEMVQRGSDNISTVATDHPLHGVIYESPNFDQSALDFWDFMNLSLEFWGDAFASITKKDGRIVSMYPVHPAAMTVRRLSGGRIQYSWTDQGRRFTKLDRDVFHVRGPGGNPLGGMSTLQYGVEAFSSALAADRAAAGMFRNGLRPSGVIKFAQFLTPTEREEAKKIVEDFQGAMNAGKPWLAEGGIDYEQISVSPEDAQMLETRQHSVEEICRFFQVPPALIGHAGSSTAWPTSVDQQVLMFNKFSLRRRVKRLEQAVRKQLLTPTDRAQGYTARINMDGLLRGDPASRAKFYQTMIQIGAMTINEVRELENRAPIDGGNIPRIQQQNVPVSQTKGLNDDAG